MPNTARVHRAAAVPISGASRPKATSIWRANFRVSTTSRKPPSNPRGRASRSAFITGNRKELAMAKPEDTMILETTKGKVVIEMRPDLAPGHVARIKELVKQGF